MKNQMTKQKSSAICYVAISVALALFAALMLDALWMRDAAMTKAQTQLDEVYKTRMLSAQDGFNKIETALSSMRVTFGERAVGEALSDVHSTAQLTSEAFNSIPIDYREAMNTNSFLNELASWSASGNVETGALDGFYRAAIVAANGYNEFVAQSEGKSFVKGNIMFKDPFGAYESESTAPRCFEGLNALSPITQEQAAQTLKDVLSLDSVRFIGEETDPDSYEFTFAFQGESGFASITKKGGKILNIVTADNGDGFVEYTDDAGKVAVKTARKLGYDKMSVVKAVSGSSLYVTLAPEKDGIVYYTDAVKVKLSSSLQPTGFEAYGYCAYHDDNVYQATLTEEEARAKLPSDLTVESVRLAVSLHKGEKRVCYEFTVEKSGDRFRTFICAQNGEQLSVENILTGTGV